MVVHRFHSPFRVPPGSPGRSPLRRGLVLAALCAGLLPAGLWPNAARAEAAPRFELPVDCAGTTCFVQNYFDHDPAGGWRDYRCGTLSYDGHTGTDIRVPSLVEMRRGVPVLAAAPGRVRAVRDGMPDVDVREAGPETVKGRGAGNWVAVTHERGWETQYSHLLRGSVAVKPGDIVRKGQRLGLIGLSGNTEFPHLEFAVRHEGRPVDPFVGLGEAAGCRLGESPLWAPAALEALGYRETGLLVAGFSPDKPDARTAQEGRYAAAVLPRDAGVLVFWVEVFGAQRGDREQLRLLAPDGSVLADKRASVPGNKARWFSFAGKPLRGGAWPPGVYRGEYRLTRTHEGREATVLDLHRELEVR